MGEMHKRRWMQTLHRAPLFFCSCLPISSIRTGGITGGRVVVIRRLVLWGRCTLPVPTGGNDAFSWRSGEFGRKVSPCSARGEQSLRRRKLFASPQPRRRFPRYRVAFWLSFHGMSSLYRRKIVPHRCFVQQDEMFQILSSIFPSFFLKHVAILFEE